MLEFGLDGGYNIVLVRIGVPKKATPIPLSVCVNHHHVSDRAGVSPKMRHRSTCAQLGLFCLASVIAVVSSGCSDSAVSPPADKAAMKEAVLKADDRPGAAGKATRSIKGRVLGKGVGEAAPK